jgi:hypothetical protein
VKAVTLRSALFARVSKGDGGDTVCVAASFEAR